MRRHLALWSVLASAALPALTASQPASRERHSVAIAHVTVIDVARGRRLDRHTVVVEGGRITAVGPDAAVLDRLLAHAAQAAERPEAPRQR